MWKLGSLGKDLNMNYAGTSVVCVFSKYARLLLLLVWGSTIWSNPLGWLIKYIGLYLRGRFILLRESDGCYVVSCWFISDWVERLVLYVLVGKPFLIIDRMTLYLFSCRVFFGYYLLPLSFESIFFGYFIFICPLF